MQNSTYYTNSGLTSLPEYQGGGYLDQYGRQSYGLGKFVKKITKPFAKVLDKIVPNEIKPALPYLAALAPFMLGPTFTLGGLGSAASRAIAAAGANAFSQLSQEGAAERGLNLPSLGLAAAGGYLSTPGVSESLDAGRIVGNASTNIQSGISNISGIDDLAQLGYAGSTPVTQGMITAGQGIPTNTDLSFLQQAENTARSIGSYGSETLSKGTEAFQNIAGGAGDTTDLINLGKAYTPGAIGAAGEQAYNAAMDANKKYQDELAAMGQTVATNRQQQIDYIRSAMITAGFNDDEIASAITRSGFNQGGYAGYAQGGIMDLGGMEMDYRAKGGFVPIGKKERADDVPARLSKNEFVFTAKAVRNAGDGDVRKGAKKMYQIMNQLEARS
jgi:hypothetical protein